MSLRFFRAFPEIKSFFLIKLSLRLFVPSPKSNLFPDKAVAPPFRAFPEITSFFLIKLSPRLFLPSHEIKSCRENIVG